MFTAKENTTPNYTPLGATFFVTFSLFDAFPPNYLEKLTSKLHQTLLEIEMKTKQMHTSEEDKNKLILKLQTKAKLHHNKIINRFLDSNMMGECFLKNENIANTVAHRMHEYDGTLYDLITFCIMPNHVHLLIDLSVQLPSDFDGIRTPANYVPLKKIIKYIKGGSARVANKLLRRSGKFWKHGYHHHYIRNEKAHSNILAYILTNPVQANIVEEWEDFPHTYYKYS